MQDEPVYLCKYSRADYYDDDDETSSSSSDAASDSGYYSSFDSVHSSDGVERSPPIWIPGRKEVVGSILEEHAEILSTSEPLQTKLDDRDEGLLPGETGSAPEADKLPDEDALKEQVWLIMDTMPKRYKDELQRLRDCDNHPLVKYMKDIIDQQIDHGRQKGKRRIKPRAPNRLIMENALKEKPLLTNNKLTLNTTSAEFSSPNQSNYSSPCSSTCSSDIGFQTPENEFPPELIKTLEETDTPYNNAAG
ncbi:hypothetical protein TRICI_001038 [Trichomonascus ciferrii]|uniref:Uncharacterized protein n=1 Tax=Trichomonascus ciferrii TaxID=44093 RepID=A0A642VAJ9_9ASCO|nr:hypothetical protein TRICI_001038 [Trichomonascus ciferrii]